MALVAYESMNAAGERLIDSALLNSILVLMVVTSLLGTILAQRFATKMAAVEL
ncbi:MAG: hypothetical protein ACK5V5_00855 [Cyclobacteriaceae bacterium]|nr:hypothetical protein [Flammeovirgaceae bacterium]